MNSNDIPETDSIQALAQFWDSHDLTDFDNELEEVTKTVFNREAVMEVYLSSNEAKTVKEIADSQGVGAADLIRSWIIEKTQIAQH
ncbi:MAG: hypothetical protein GY862_05495 [Gammaproteobacteria bacterium]|nr:hypothetical protein [Gammaproteobacteria bacterium]